MFLVLLAKQKNKRAPRIWFKEIRLRHEQLKTKDFISKTLNWLALPFRGAFLLADVKVFDWAWGWSSAFSNANRDSLFRKIQKINR